MTKDNDDALQLANQIDQFKDKRMNDSAAHLRRLVAENEALNHYRKVYGEVSTILACTAEVPPPSDDDEITVERLKALVRDFEVYVDSCEAKADRIDRLGEAIVRLRTENEAKDALLRQAVAVMGLIGADLVCEAGHHEKKDRHEIGEPCPIEKRWHDTFLAIRQHLDQKTT